MLGTLVARDSERWALRFRNARLLAIAARAWNFHVALKARLRSVRVAVSESMAVNSNARLVVLEFVHAPWQS